MMRTALNEPDKSERDREDKQKKEKRPRRECIQPESDFGLHVYLSYIEIILNDFNKQR